ncbi:MAG: leucyl/phenylalanyl-tRNA--protein transferase [Phycisphaerales bacterium]|nr:leucyl/phenylalanyl-tRNA--protein transferase [Phycisphaerales bacterium]
MSDRRHILTDADQQAVDALLTHYAQGWFPMLDPDEEVVRWVQPAMRFLLPLEDGGFHIPRTLRSRVRAARFEVTCDRAFGRVIRACAETRPGREETWLDPSIIDAFELLHRAGHAHSLEAWHNAELVGGLYGLCVGSVFCGESMFSRPHLGGTDASKVCLVHLVHHLRRCGFTLLDAQLHSDHLARFGATEVPRARYLAMLRKAAPDHRAWLPFDPAVARA